MSSVRFHKKPNTKFRANLSSWSHACTCDRGTGRWKVMAKEMGAFRDDVHAPKKMKSRVMSLNLQLQRVPNARNKTGQWSKCPFWVIFALIYEISN